MRAMFEGDLWLVRAVATSARMHEAYGGASAYRLLVIDYFEWVRERARREYLESVGSTNENYIWDDFDSRSEHTDH